MAYETAATIGEPSRLFDRAKKVGPRLAARVARMRSWIGAGSADGGW